MKSNRLKFANILRNTSRYTLLIIGILVFALLSGAEEKGGGIKGILKNSSNSIPWLVLLLMVWVAWKWELVGGILITTIGLIMVWFFNIAGNNFFLVTFILTLVITFLGLFFILSWWLRKESK